MNFFETKIKIAVMLSLAAVVFPQSVFVASAQTIDELKQQKDALQAKLSDLNRQINTFQGQIASTQKQANSLKNDIFIFDTQIKSTELQIQAKETQIIDANLQIAELQKQIERRLGEIAENHKLLTQLLGELNQLDGNSFLQVTFGNSQFSDFLDRLEYTSNVQDKVYTILQNIKAVKSQLETQQAGLRVELKKMEELKEQLQISKDSLSGQRTQKERLLAQTKGVERNYQKLLSVSKDEEADLQKEIQDLDNKVREKLGKRTISPNDGVLAKPMDGILTQGYGNTGFTVLGYNFHNGIDLAAPAGTPIYAAADGTVTSCDTGEAAYGNWCAIKHSVSTKSGTRQIITLYAHMRTIKVKVGQSVSQGDLVGYEGNTGNTTRLLYGEKRGFHLHLTVFDAEGFGVAPGAHTNVYGPYTVPFGYTYNPLDFF